MGTYFENAELDALWTRILAATTALCGNIGGTGLKHVHNALLSHTGLVRSATPVTPADYLVGICRCAKSVGGDTSAGEIGLARVAELLENPASAAGWLFQGEYFEIGEERDDLPGLEGGKSYTCFVGGAQDEGQTFTYNGEASAAFEAYWAYYNATVYVVYSRIDKAWYVTTDDNLASCLVSIYCNG